MAEINAKDATDYAGKIARTVGDAVGKKADEIADQGRKAGADAASSVGRAAGKLADRLDNESPAVADFVRSASEQAKRLADDLRDRTVGEVVNSAIQFGRSQPLLTIAGAALLVLLCYKNQSIIARS